KVSTTHAITGSIGGVGAMPSSRPFARASPVRSGAWLLTDSGGVPHRRRGVLTPADRGAH
ncbi:MAG: inorganic phosphate transporter, partial [Acidobacteriota bacterium]|nr:inorganic phosphate transporter [Acidobacteriota bacterium]